ncbi:hypothetical protein BD626DRAFT_397384 [Schizophyllum amplum]|uniref:DUF1308 domain-containing protein n=1 Tax=Schizophyllum amplum TaxID=97359 RepID=A0A550CPW5_9AGAR|nr:hypothetical protein BD626DRAFT_397384 [Auriculariopsis ampla]
MADSVANDFHPELRALRLQLQDILFSIEHFHPPAPCPPIIDSSVEFIGTSLHEEQWLQRRHTPGLKKLKEAVRVDYDVLDKFLDNPASAHLPPLSTNAPYLLAVWNEVLCAPPPLAAIFKSMPIAPRRGKDAREKGGDKAGAAKIDIVAEGGRTWIRVNTIKNSRMLAEFREIDSYDTGSEEEDDDDYPVPSLRQKDFDNSIMRLGRTLVAAAQTDRVDGTGRTPAVVLRLTRLSPDGEDADPRIGQTIRMLGEMGITVELGERRVLPPFPGQAHTNATASSSSSTPPSPVCITPDINLDLSILIALTSDLTHAPLPSTVEEAQERFIPPPRYREWRKTHRAALKGKSVTTSTSIDPEKVHDNEDPDVAPHQDDDLAKHTRQLTTQVLQEMGCGLFQDMHTQISALRKHDPEASVRFWTTREARDRCVRIVMKIGGVAEKRRVWAMFPEVVRAVFPEEARAIHMDAVGAPTADDETVPMDPRRAAYWRGSRYALDHVPMLPIRIYTASPDDMVAQAGTSTAGEGEERLRLGLGSTFSRALAHTCRELLAQDVVPHPRTVKKVAAGHFVPLSSDEEDNTPTNGETQSPRTPKDGARPAGRTSVRLRAQVTRANPRLTAHTIDSLLYGAALGWTTLTANKTSVKGVMKEMGDWGIEGNEDGDRSNAALWIVDPRSLGEEMRADYVV